MGPYRDWFVATRALQLHPVIGRACPWVHVGIGLLLPALASGSLAVSFNHFLFRRNKQLNNYYRDHFPSGLRLFVSTFCSTSVLGVIIFATIVTTLINAIPFCFWTSRSSKDICTTVITDREVASTLSLVLVVSSDIAHCYEIIVISAPLLCKPLP